MIDGTSLTFAPLLPWPLLAVLAAMVVSACALGLWRRARGILWRGAMLLLGVLALANPVMVREQRQPLGDIVSVLVDRTPSQTINQRPQKHVPLTSTPRISRRHGALVVHQMRTRRPISKADFD